MSPDTDRTKKSLVVWLVIGSLVFLGLVVWMLRTGGSIWAATNGCSDTRFKAPLDTIREVMREQNTPSVSIAVAERGRVTCEAAFGFADIAREIPATPATLYSLASISKPITATAIMRLVEEKKIDLQRPANAYLGEAKLRAFEGRAEDATIERLLTHTAGLPLHYQFFYAGGPAVPPMDTAISRYGIIVYPPGERFVYSNFGFGVLERILERVDGRPYVDVLRRTVLDPLGLTETIVSDGANLDGRRAALRYGNDRTAIPPYGFDHFGASGVWSSARDLIRFGMFHLGHDAKGRGRAISRGTRDRMQRQHAPADGAGRGRGLGWAIADVNGWRQVAHTGSMPGVATILALYPDADTAIVVLTNINNSQAGARMERALREAVLPRRAETTGPEAPASPPAPSTPLQSVIGGRWSGSLHLPSGEKTPLELIVDDDGVARLRAGADAESAVENARFANGVFTARTALRLIGPDAAPDDRRMENRVTLTLIPRGGHRLSGWVASNSSAVPPYGAVSFAVQLSKDSAPRPAFTYACPPGPRAVETPPGICAAAIPGEVRARDIAIASGTHSRQFAVATSGNPAAVFVTANDGADWRHVTPLNGPTIRTSIAFDPQGALHLAAEQPDGLRQVSSADFAATWTEPLAVAAQGPFPKLTAGQGALWLTWGYRADYRLGFASNAGGRGWSRPAEPPGECVNTSEALIANGAALVACAGLPPGAEEKSTRGRSPFTGIRIYRVNAGGELGLHASLPELKGVWPRLLGHGNTMVMVADVWDVHGAAGKGWDKCCFAMTRSSDGGRTWSPLADLGMQLKTAARWTTRIVRAAALDSEGRLHLIVTGSHQAAPANGAPGTDSRFVHAVFDPATGALVHEASLTAPADAPQGFYAGSAALAASGESVIAAWTTPGKVHYTRITPAGPADPGGIEQTSMGTQPPATLVTSFDGLGVGFEGPHGNPLGRNPSDNSLAVGPNHVFQIVNSRFAIFEKTGKVLHGSAPTNTLFKGFGGTCEARNNGDGVVRYDQLANRWLVVMPIFRRAAERPDQPPVWTAREQAWDAPPGVAGQPGPAAKLFVPPPAPPTPAAPPSQPPGAGRGQQPPPDKGPYSICYAISTSPDPLGSWYRYEFLRPLFPDYPRPAVWPDGYYVPTSTGDDVIQKHVCIAERDKMLKGLPAREQCLVIDGVNFLNNSDLHGTRLPPRGAPNVMMATGGTQLKNDFDDDGIYYWNVNVDWKDPSKTRAAGPTKIAVAPYRYLCDGQLTNCVPQPGTDRRLDAQGDKIMAQLVYRNVDGRESIVAVHSVATSAGGGGVRWYEFAADRSRKVSLRQQGTYAPDGFYRWMASPAIDRNGNIGIGYSFGGTPHFAGQRFAARRASDPLGQLTLKETILVEGEGSQTTTMRWEDYTQTAIDPSDDCTIWYVGDYFRKDATTYSTKIGAFRLPGCGR